MLNTPSTRPPLVAPKEAEERVSKWLVDPRTLFMRRWDVLTVWLLAFTAVVTPFEVAFLTTDLQTALFWINRLVDACFVVDLIINLHLMYLDGNNEYVVNRWRIAAHYLRRFFIIDLVSVLPFDAVGLFMGGGGGGGQDVSQLKILRVVRLLRLMKLLRIVRSGRVFRRLEASLSLNYAVLQLSKFVLGTCIIAHWMACACNMVTLIESEEFKCFGGEGSGGPPAEAARAEAMDCSWVSNYFREEQDWRQRYVAALYWSVMTICTVVGSSRICRHYFWHNRPKDFPAHAENFRHFRGNFRHYGAIWEHLGAFSSSREGCGAMWERY